ncbi:MAG: phage portal protein [Planctomycetes bacterium]|nr:phage portal protein [Planctomycetota bacterium]
MTQDLLTKAISFVSPKAALDRMVNQAKLRNFGRFDSALTSEKRGISRGVSGGEDTSGTRERYSLIRAARDLADNFPPVRSLLLKFATYVSGRIAYQARTGNREADTAIERYWQKWCNDCDFLGRHNFTTLLQLAVTAMLRDGDCGFIIVRDKEDLKLQSVEADRIGSPYDRTDTDKYIGGINIDDYGRPVSYTIFTRTINNQYISPVDIVAKEFIHLFDAARLDEYRGRSAFATALNATRDLQEAIKAEVQAIKYASYQSGVITTESGAADAGDYFARGNSNDQGQVARLQSLDPGTVNYLSAGEKMEMFKSDRPTGAFGEFIRLVQAHICMAVGLPYGFAFDADKSGPMARMEAAMAERTFLRWRGLLEGQFLNRIKNVILLDAASRGLIPDSEYLLDGRWCWPAKVSIDYGREARADIELWKAGLKTAGQIYSDMGEDYEEALRARAKEAAMIVALGAEMDIPSEYISDSIIPIQASAPIAAPIAQEEPQPEQTQEQSKQTDLADENKPSKGMVEEALKGLKWREEYNRGGTAVGVARARDISNGKNLSDDTVKRMHSFFSRHEVDKKGQGFQQGEDGFPSAGRIAWALWGGDAGQTWAADKVKGMQASQPEQMKVSLAVRDTFGRITGFETKHELVMPTPEKDEEQDDFIGRCMVSGTMTSEYPDESQRVAVCSAQWEKK